MPEPLDLSMFVRRDAGLSHLDLAVEGIGCAGCIRKIEGGLKRIPGIVDARLNFTNRRLAVELARWRAGGRRRDQRARTIGYRAHPFEPERAETDEARHARWLMKCLAVAGFAAHEHHAAVGVGVVRQRGDMTQETRDFFHWLSALIALPAAAYAGQPFFRSALRAIRGAAAQHGRADLARRPARARHVGGRDAQPRPARLFRFRHHAAVLPAVRPLARPRHAAQDARRRRQSRGAEGRGRAPLRGPRRTRDGAGRGAQAGRPAAGAAGRTGAGRRQS